MGYGQGMNGQLRISQLRWQSVKAGWLDPTHLLLAQKLVDAG